MFDALRHCARLLTAARVLARYDALVPREFADQVPALVRWAGRVARIWPTAPGAAMETEPPGQRLAAALNALGPTYIKLGQFLATRPDIIGEAIARDLQQLQDRLPPFPMHEAKATLASELGRPVDEVFSDFSQPVNAASIAQVHKATTRPLGDETDSKQVAVKILRPGIEASFHRDMEAFAWLAATAERLRPALKRLEPVKLVATLRESVEMEMDLRLEAAAASEMAENIQGRQGFRVPKVDWLRTSRRVLTAEWIEATPLSDRRALTAQGIDTSALARTVVQTFLTHALFDGFFHADMHQGNLMVDREGDLVAVDFGIMGRLDRDTRAYLAQILFGFLTRDYQKLADIHFDAGYVPANQSRHTFAQALRAVGEPIFGRQAADISMGRLLTQLFQVTEQFDMHLQPQLVLLQKTMVVVEGVARDLDPNLNIWDVSRPIVERWMAEHFNPEAKLRDLATDTLAAGQALGRSLGDLPETVRHIQTLAKTLDGEGLRLHPDTARAIAEASHRRRKSIRAALWTGAAALVLIALAVLW